jgi:DNA-binding NarL/FixJ family response regulator
MAKQKLRVLVVEDNAVVRLALTGLLRQDENILVVGEAASGEAGLEAVKTLNPHVVCLDVLLPGIGGLEVLRTIRQEHPGVRVVIITGEATSEVLKEAQSLGAHGFVVKPFNGAKVLRAIYGALRQGGAGPQ